MNEAQDIDLSDLWLPLLRRLTEASSAWGTWKSPNNAFAGRGDVDSCAPESDWPMIEDEFHAWAEGNGLVSVGGCKHVPGVLFLAAIDPETRKLHELDVNGRKYFRGWTMFRPEDLADLMHIDPRGFRSIRPGAEGLIQLVQNGLLWGGRQNPEGLRIKGVVPKLKGDPEGADEASRLFGRSAPAIRAAWRATVEGGWDRRSMLGVEARALSHAPLEPGVAASRVWAKFVKRRCPLLKTLFAGGRAVPADLDAWVSEARRVHPVMRTKVAA